MCSEERTGCGRSRAGSDPGQNDEPDHVIHKSPPGKAAAKATGTRSLLPAGGTAGFPVSALDSQRGIRVEN